MIFLIIFLTLILGIVIWGGVTQWRFIGKSEKNNDDRSKDKKFKKIYLIFLKIKYEKS